MYRNLKSLGRKYGLYTFGTFRDDLKIGTRTPKSTLKMPKSSLYSRPARPEITPMYMYSCHVDLKKTSIDSSEAIK